MGINEFFSEWKWKKKISQESSLVWSDVKWSRYAFLLKNIKMLGARIKSFNLYDLAWNVLDFLEKLNISGSTLSHTACDFMKKVTLWKSSSILMSDVTE